MRYSITTVHLVERSVMIRTGVTVRSSVCGGPDLLYPGDEGRHGQAAAGSSAQPFQDLRHRLHRHPHTRVPIQ